MLPISNPFDPAQPNVAVYGFGELEIFEEVSRDGLAAQGAQADDFNSSLPAKYWYDSTAASLPATQLVTYNTLKVTPTSTGITAEIVQFQIPAGQAAVPNIPGQRTFPPYVIAPTTAMSGTSLVNPSVLSNYADALALAQALGLPPSSIIAGPGLTWNQETRRAWEIVIPGNPNPYEVGTLLLDQYANGVGFPGAWSIRNSGAANAQAVWTPVPTGPDGISTGVPTQEVPIPLRLMLPNEQPVNAGIAGMMIARTDLATADILGTAPAGGLTQAQAALLAAIYTAVTGKSA